MKIISKYKDYYDYLTGMYGVDEKLILDRRKNDSYTLLAVAKITFYIAGYIIEGLLTDNKNILFGKDLNKYASGKKSYIWRYMHNNRDFKKSIHISYKSKLLFSTFEDWFYTEPVKDINETNNKHNCPILMETVYGISKYPKLSVFKLASILPEKTIYLWLTEWLSNRISISENITKELSDSLKIINKGFDLKHSFRPNIKT